MSIQPIEVWGHWGGPNPWKVVIILEELDLPYNLTKVEFSDVKNSEYLKVNPNGRLPAIKDPNTGVVLWESAAIILYLAEVYDKEGKLTYSGTPEKYLLQQWLAFQASGQGPYFGQATWFARFHPEKVQSAIERYVNEIIRVTGVLDEALARNGTGWLVGGKCTYADLSFVTWAAIGEGLLTELGQGDALKSYTNYASWISSLKGREKVAGCLEAIAKGRADHGLN